MGGVDWDARIVNYLLSNVQTQHGIDLADDAMAMQRVGTAAERAKIELSTKLSTTIILPFLAAGPDVSIHFDTTLTRADVEGMSQDLIERCKGVVDLVLERGRDQRLKVDRVVMVGGATRMPAVVEFARSITGREPETDTDPDIVAVGAAWRAGMLAGDVDDMVLRDRVA